jgi:predicted XRE-type DNA-binding protein
MEINRENLLSLIKTGIKRNALSMSGLEKEANVPRDTVRDFMRGKTQVLRADKLQKIMKVLEPQEKILVVGHVGAGAEIIFIDPEKDKGDYVDCPPDYTPSDVLAVRVKGDGMLPVFHDGWIIYYGRRGDVPVKPISGGWQVPYGGAAKSGSKQFAEFLGRPCIVGLAEGRALLGTLKRGTARNSYDLINYNASDRRNIRPKWAARILFIKTV